MKQELLQRIWKLEKLEGFNGFGTLVNSAIPAAVRWIAILAIVTLLDIIGVFRSFPALDAGLQIFIHVFMRMKQVRRLNLLRSNCVYLVLAVYKLFSKVRTNTI
ncbi:putative integral membrane protein [Babesia bovis T2Bo]|uniref:Uncharacterized protein n=1 Tax=Babesia bovis TaxID=5865 RepID=A7APA0_BABBO|nr:putative integral membrane protein [Babesia bovis T2Bo]EDO08384.1 putative integral membrane protein [Babesia bovis T2Bo]|eukprot:XP_001611952.1 hypothetical protein [Babesia bovis T2Bo]